MHNTRIARHPPRGPHDVFYCVITGYKENSHGDFIDRELRYLFRENPVENQEIPGVGAFTLFADPDGRVNGMWKQMAK